MLKHLPMGQWPSEDRAAFQQAFSPGDIFDESQGKGQHLAAGTRQFTLTGYGRWLGFLAKRFPDQLTRSAAERISPNLVKAFIEELEVEVRNTTIGIEFDALYRSATLIAPSHDWGWLRALKGRLIARGKPEDRFDRLVPPWEILDLGIELMDSAWERSTPRLRALQFREGLILAVLSVWPIRRRSIAALTVDGHVERTTDATALLLFPADTKSRRAERLQLPELLVPYLRRYLADHRLNLVRVNEAGLWGSAKGGRLSAGRIYDIARRRIFRRFGKSMSLHDFRRSAATFTAIMAPELVGIIAGVLQHASPDVGEKHYNLARSASASRRLGKVLGESRQVLARVRT